MNQDIVYEILKQLHLFGEALIAKRTILSMKAFSVLERRKIDRPVILEVVKNDYFALELDKDSIIYWGDSTYECSYLPKDYLRHTYKIAGSYIVRIFGQRKVMKFSHYVKKVISIGDLTDLSNMFCNLSPLLCNGKSWDTSRVTRMSNMFRRCRELKEKIGKNWNTSNVTDMTYMFDECPVLNKNIGKYWNTSNVRYMAGMFHRCINLDKTVGKYWNTSNVIDMSWMFYGCANLTKIEVKNWDISKVESMHCMFSYCKKLTLIDCQNWDVSEVKDTDYMFSDTNLDVSVVQNWNFSQKCTNKTMFVQLVN